MMLSHYVNTLAMPTAAAASRRPVNPTMAPEATQRPAVAAPAPKTVLQGPEQTLPAAAEPAQAVPSFITPASLVTVSGGTAAVTLLWQVSKLLVGKSAGSPWVPFVISVLVGTVIYLISIQDKKVQATMEEKVVGMFIGFVNSMVLFAAAVGILGKG